ncbi:MAG: ABC transporter permease, partial [Saprospiraceae bacterium]
MKTLFIKDLNLFFSDKKTILLTFVMPVVLVTVFALAFSGLRSDNRKSSNLDAIKIGYIDEEGSVASKAVISALGEAEALILVEADSAKTYNALSKGQIIGVLHIYNGFMEAWASRSAELPWAFHYQAGNDFEINMFRSFFEPMMGRIGQQYTPEDLACQELAFQLPFEAAPNSQVASNDAYNDPWLIQPIIGIAIILLLFNTINIGGHLIDEFNNKTLNRLLLGPVSYRAFVSSKFILTFLICVLQLTIILAYSQWVLGLKLFELPTIAFLVLVISFAAAAFCLLMVSLCKTRNQLNGISIGTILFLSAIGGSMMPRFIMPAAMQQ